MENLGERLRQRRKMLKLTQKQVAKDTGLTPSSVTQWELGATKPSGENLYALCKTLQCEPDWLLYGKGKPSNEYYVAEPSILDNKSKLGDGETELPLYTEEQIVAYSKDPDGAYVAGSKIRFKISDLANVDITRAVCTTAPGNSMGPFIPDGAWVGVDTLNTTITDGKIYIIEHSGMLRIKTLYRTPGGGMRLTSSNREEHPDETYSNDESKNIRIIGRVFWYSVLV